MSTQPNEKLEVKGRISPALEGQIDLIGQINSSGQIKLNSSLYERLKQTEKGKKSKIASPTDPTLKGVGWDQHGYPATRVPNLLKAEYHGDGESLLSAITPSSLAKVFRTLGKGQDETNRNRFNAFIGELDNIYYQRTGDVLGQVSAIKDLFASERYKADRSYKQDTAPPGTYQKAYELAELCFCIFYKEELAKLNKLSKLTEEYHRLEFEQDKSNKTGEIEKLLGEDQALPTPYNPVFRINGEDGKESKKKIEVTKELLSVGNLTTLPTSPSSGALVSSSITSITNSNSSSSSSSSSSPTGVVIPSERANIELATLN